jgi:hypothetical protein
MSDLRVRTDRETTNFPARDLGAASTTSMNNATGTPRSTKAERQIRGI